MKERLSDNIQIVSRLRNYLIKNPQLRFIQALWALDIISRNGNMEIEDRFFEEPWDTLQRVKAREDL